MPDQEQGAVSDGDGDQEAAPPESPSEPQTPEVEAAPDETVEDPEKKKLHEEAAKHRIRAKEERQKREALEAQLNSQREQLKAVQESLGITDNGDGEEGDVPDLMEKAKEQTRRAETALIRSEFTQAALDAGIRPDRIGAAWKLAKDDLGSVEVDLDSGEVAGVTEVAQRAVEEMPELTRKEAPKVDDRKSGGPKGPTIDLSDVKRGDMRRLRMENPEEFRKLVEGGLSITLSHDPDGNPLQAPITMGGSRLAHEVRETRRRIANRRSVDND